MLDANQASAECYNASDVKPYSIEWLKVHRGLTDPFIALTGRRPLSTTQTPMRDIDYFYTWGILPTALSTLPLNTPAQSDHLGIIFDLDLAKFFDTSYSDMGVHPTHFLSSGNKKAVDVYLDHVPTQFDYHKISKRTYQLLDAATKLPTNFTLEHQHKLHALDQQITEILLAAERKCSNKHINRDPWTPQQQLIGGTLSYWKQKLAMYNKSLFHWDHLNKLRRFIDITDESHCATDIDTIVQALRYTRSKWML
jgi:hypothetical protein